VYVCVKSLIFQPTLPAIKLIFCFPSDSSASSSRLVLNLGRENGCYSQDLKKKKKEKTFNVNTHMHTHHTNAQHRHTYAHVHMQLFLYNPGDGPKFLWQTTWLPGLPL
jgi:hypothetical protein